MFSASLPTPSRGSSTGHSLVATRWQTNYMPGMEGKESAHFLCLHLAAQAEGCTVVNNDCYVNG